MTLYSDLPHISQVTPVTEADAPLLAKIYDLLKEHGQENRFGINLLHQHFPMAEHEVMREDTDDDARVQTLTVTDLDKEEKYIATSFRLGPNGRAETICICPNVKDHYHISVGR